MKRERKRKKENNSNASQEENNARNELKVSTQNQPIADIVHVQAIASLSFRKHAFDLRKFR